MTRHRRRNPLDFTERQMQNLLVLVGVAIVVFMVATQFPLDPFWAGLLTALLFGQKLIPWGNGRGSSDGSVGMGNDPPGSSDQGGARGGGVVPRGSRASEPKVRDDPDVGADLRHIHRWARC